MECHLCQSRLLRYSLNFFIFFRTFKIFQLFLRFLGWEELSHIDGRDLTSLPGIYFPFLLNNVIKALTTWLNWRKIHVEIILHPLNLPIPVDENRKELAWAHTVQTWIMGLSKAWLDFCVQQWSDGVSPDCSLNSSIWKHIVNCDDTKTCTMENSRNQPSQLKHAILG